jgi:hypothetical protein
MPLNMNLSGSVAKIAWARQHLDSAEGVHARFIRENKPYSIAVEGPNDATDGWCSIFLVGPHEVSEPVIGLIVGDCIHNLRCAMDYIVVALVQASSTRLSSKHQFPIFDKRDDYLRLVGTETSAKGDGMLKGVKVGLKEIWAVQPFHAEPKVITHALHCLNRFSNADKHRILSTDMHLPGSGGGSIETDGQIIETWDNPERIVLGVRGHDEKFEVARRRFAKPYPKYIRFNAKISVDILVGTPAFGKYRQGLALKPAMFYDLCDTVASIVEIFKKL